MADEESGACESLDEHTMLTLMEQGIDTMEELASRQYTDRDYENFFLAPGYLTTDQCEALKAAVGNHCPSVTSYPVDSRRQADDEPECCGMAEDEDEDLQDEQLQLALWMSSTTVREGPHNLHESNLESSELQDEDFDDAGIEDTVRLLLLGKTGTGKSTTGNTILGQKRFNTASSFGSVTSVCDRHVGSHRNTRIEIMDSPGLYDTEKKHEEICTLIIQAVAGMHPGPHAILYVIKVGRYTKEEHSAYGRLKALFDNDVSKHIIVVFTHGDQLLQEGTTLEAMLTASDVPASLKQVLDECGNRCILFNNVAQDTRSQVDDLLQLVRTLTAANRGRPYSCPKYSKIGEGLEEEVNKRMVKYEERELQRNRHVQELKRRTQEAEQRAAKTRREFERREEQRESEERKEADRRRRMEKDLKNQKAAQDAQLRKQQKQLDKLREQISRQQEEEQLRVGQQASVSQERERRLTEELEDMRLREREMMELIQQRGRMEEERRQADREDLARLEQERETLLRYHEEQRRKDMEEMDRRNREFTDRLEREREAEREREKQRWKEMNTFKNRVVKNKEPDFLSKVGSVLAAPFRALGRLFS